MSLNWSAENVTDFKKKVRKQINSAKLDAIVWSSMSVGINEITKKNVHLFYFRLSAVERTFGAMLFKNKKPLYLTLEDVKMFIGLRTNVSRVTASEFEKHLSGYLNSQDVEK